MSKEFFNSKECPTGLHLTCVHWRRWGIDACSAQPQSTIKGTKYSLNRKTQLMNGQPHSLTLICKPSKAFGVSENKKSRKNPALSDWAPPVGLEPTTL